MRPASEALGASAARLFHEALLAMFQEAAAAFTAAGCSCSSIHAATSNSSVYSRRSQHLQQHVAALTTTGSSSGILSIPNSSSTIHSSSEQYSQ